MTVDLAATTGRCDGDGGGGDGGDDGIGGDGDDVAADCRAARNAVQAAHALGEHLNSTPY